jgi:hypothetical protein
MDVSTISMSSILPYFQSSLHLSHHVLIMNIPVLLSVSIILVCSCQRTVHQPVLEATEQELFDNYVEQRNNRDNMSDSAYFTSGQRLWQVEQQRDPSLIHSFLSVYFDSMQFAGTQFQPRELIRYFYTIDFNNDDQLDIAYEGPTGGEPTMTEFYLQDSLKFRKVFSGYQKVTSLTFDNEMLAYFTLANPGCCADPQIVEYTYSVSFAEPGPAFRLIKTIGFLMATELVKDTFKQPKPFKVKQHNARLRAESIVFEGIINPAWDNNGNIIGLYKTGSTGTALGSKQDSTGAWLFVMMHAINKPDSCVFTTFLEQPTDIYGWMKKEDVGFIGID